MSSADDINVFIIDKSMKLLYEKANSELKNIANSMIANKLGVNITTTKHLLFNTAKHKSVFKEVGF